MIEDKARQGINGSIVSHSDLIPSSTEWRGAGMTPFTPHVFIDISSVIDKKLAAMKCYASESPAFPHPRSIEALEARAKYWGSVSGCHAAEPFMIARKIERL